MGSEMCIRDRKLVGQNIKTLGLVAGFKDFQADICLSEIGFY